MRRTAARRFALLGALAVIWSATVVWAGGQDWNDSSIQWMSYDAGLAEAKKTDKPICLIFYTTWCPHCTNYSKVFSDPEVVKKSKSFVMIRLDKDQNKELSKQYAPDGEYIPRTLFLSPDGKLDAGLTEARPQYKYFYDEKNPAAILGGMDRALKQFGKS
jgi:protein-disulfide reductase (glutathione)